METTSRFSSSPTSNQFSRAGRSLQLRPERFDVAAIIKPSKKPPGGVNTLPGPGNTLLHLSPYTLNLNHLTFKNLGRFSRFAFAQSATGYLTRRNV
jgi:hypothetical protein